MHVKPWASNSSSQRLQNPLIKGIYLKSYNEGSHYSLRFLNSGVLESLGLRGTGNPEPPKAGLSVH